MSERTDMKNKIPEYKLENKSLVYHSKGWLNHLAQTTRYLLNKSITSKNSIVSVNSDWDNLEPNTVSQVNSWSGPHAPKLEGTGVVITLSNADGYQNYQCALSEGEFASRLVGQKWSYTDGSDHNQLVKLGSQIQNLIRDNNLTNNSLISDTNNIFSYLNSNITSFSNLTSNLSTSTSSNFSSESAQFNIQSNQISGLGTNKEDKTSEASDVNNINKSLNTKENILDGIIPNPDLNQDTKVGNFIINKPTELRHDPHTTYQHHDVGFLQVRNSGDKDLLQVLYLALGDPNNQVGDNVLDGNGAISYRFMYYYPKQKSIWQPWHTIPYQSDFDNFKNQSNSNFAANNSNVSSYVNSLNDKIFNDSNKAREYTDNTASTLRSYTDSETDVVTSIANNYYNATNSKETSDFDQVTNQMNSMTSSARSETATRASIEADSLVNSMTSATGSEVGQLQGAILNIENFENMIEENDKNTQNQISSLGTNVSNNYNTLSNANTSLKQQVPNDINNAINKNNTNLQGQWNNSIADNNTIIRSIINAKISAASSNASNYTSQVGSSNSNYTSSEVGSLDTRLWGISSELNGSGIQQPIREAKSIADEISGIKDSIDNNKANSNLNKQNWQEISSMVSTNQENINDLEADEEVLASETYENSSNTTTLSSQTSFDSLSVTNSLSDDIDTLSYGANAIYGPAGTGPTNPMNATGGLFQFSIDQLNGVYVDYSTGIPISQLDFSVPLDNLINEPTHPLTNYSYNSGLLRAYNNGYSKLLICKMYFTNGYNSSSCAEYTYLQNTSNSQNTSDDPADFLPTKGWVRVHPAP